MKKGSLLHLAVLAGTLLVQDGRVEDYTRWHDAVATPVAGAVLGQCRA